MAGVVGRHKFTYDIWGDAVYVAARLEQSCHVGRINVSEAVFEAVEPLFDLTPRGALPVKNKAPLAMYFLERAKTDLSHLSRDADGSQLPDGVWSMPSLGLAARPLRGRAQCRKGSVGPGPFGRRPIAACGRAGILSRSGR
jgi:hypothetical protein